jgi:hypothetical protein
MAEEFLTIPPGRAVQFRSDLEVRPRLPAAIIDPAAVSKKCQRLVWSAIGEDVSVEQVDTPEFHICHPFKKNQVLTRECTRAAHQ